MNRIQDLRKESGLKQSDLALALSVSRQAVSKWEPGVIDLSTETIEGLCRLFNVSADYLLGISAQRRLQVSDSDAAIIDAYHAAPPSIQAGIDAILQPFMDKKILSASSDMQKGSDGR